MNIMIVKKKTIKEKKNIFITLINTEVLHITYVIQKVVYQNKFM